MLRTNNNNIIIPLFLVLLFVSLALLPFGIYGQDGYNLWIPIISEYLKGNEVYHASSVIFNGQNLGGIYGELPFWKVFRVLNFSVIPFLNLTHAIFIATFFNFAFRITKGFKAKIETLDLIFLILFSIFSPVIENRAMVGHLNLLFGVLPFFAFLSLVFDKSRANILMVTLGCWFALSTQSYQILAYHVFYVPILVYLIWQFEQDKKKYLLLAFSLLAVAFIVNLPQFLTMYHHATNPDNARNAAKDIVYSYLESNPLDLLNLFVTSLTSTLQFRSYYFFHEVNYGMGCFLLSFWIFIRDKKFKILTAVTGLTLFFFCMNLPVFNLIAKLPLIDLFRVPQRAFMLMALFIPLWTYSTMRYHWDKKDVLIFLTILLLSQTIPSFEFLLIILIFIIYANYKNSKSTFNKDLLLRFMMLISMGSLFCSIAPRVRPSISYQAIYERGTKMIKPLEQKFSSHELRQKTFHFEGQLAPTYTYIAQSLGIRTIEGYGHPPLNLLMIQSAINGQKIDYDSNNLFFTLESPKKNELIHYFNLDYSISFDTERVMHVEALKATR